MPELDGIQLADAIRARPELAATRIVFITASVQKDQIARYMAHGASGYLALSTFDYAASANRSRWRRRALRRPSTVAAWTYSQRLQNLRR